MDKKDLENRFMHHPIKNAETAEKHDTIRNTCLRLALDINNLVPDCDEKETAVKYLEEVMFWANAGIARQE